MLSLKSMPDAVSTDAVPTAPDVSPRGVNLQSNSVVVLGAWNPAIVQPAWLSERKIVESNTAEDFSANPLTKGFFFQMDKVNWMIDEQRLQIWATGNTDTGVYASRVLSLLAHTPVQAIGTNFYFQCGINDWPRAKFPQLGEWTLEAAPPELQFEQFVWRGTRKMGADTSCQINLTRGTGDALAAHVNLHRNVDASRAAQLAGAWRADWEAAREIISQIFGVRVNE